MPIDYQLLTKNNKSPIINLPNHEINTSFGKTIKH
jgi:hypothetical protein